LRQVARSREEQLKEVKQKRENETQEHLQIGFAIKKRAQELVEEDIKDYQAKQIAAHENNLRMIAANEKIKKEKEDIRAQEEIAEEMRNSEIEVTEKRNLARKALEKRRFEKKQVQRQMIIDAAIEALSKKTSNEAAIQAKQEQELIDKEDRIIAEKEAKRQREWEETVASRTVMARARKEQRVKDFEETRKLADLAKQKALTAIENEKEQQQKAREMTIMIKNMQLQQAVQIKKEKINDKVKDLEEQKIIQEISNQDDKKFNDICTSTIRDYAAKGKPVTTLMRALEYHQPDLLPSIRNPEKNIHKVKAAGGEV